MKRRQWNYLVAVLTAALVAGLELAWAADEPRNTDRDRDAQVAKDRARSADALVYGSNIIGQPVKNREGETIGHIRELMIDPGKGAIRYGVVEVGKGVLGIGNKAVVLPWDKFQLSPTQQGYLLDLEKNALARAPEADQDWRRGEGRYERTAGPGDQPNREISGDVEQYTGTIEKIDATAGTVDIRRMLKTYTFQVGPDAKGRLTQFKVGDKVQVDYREQQGQRVIDKLDAAQ